MATQLAAIVVTDVVGSTELRARIGEDAAEALRRDHDRLLSEAVAAAGGTVVKGLGDGILACFGGAAEAVAAAVGVQRASRQLSSTHTAVSLRVGMALGDITMENDDVFGTPVIEASRLCAAAAPGQILASDLVRVLSHGRGDHTFAEFGALELKGLPTAVTAVEVLWEHEPEAPPLDVPVPAPLVLGDGLPFAGRTAGTEALVTQWKRACVEGRQLVLVTGEPGIGKTRLVSEFARTVAGQGAVVLLGRCFEDLQAPYAPFVEALHHLVSHAPESVLGDHVAAAGGDLSRLVPDLGRRLAGVPDPVVGDPDLERLRLYEAAADLLARCGELTPVLLVLDDLHWADPSTVGLLLWLVRASRPMRLAVVGTYRDTDVDRAHPFGKALADLRRAHDVERITLGGLDQTELSALLERAGGYPLDDEGRRLVELLEAETEGNPFFVGEVLRHLVESGAIHNDGTRWVGDPSTIEAGVPEGVRDVIGRRLSALGDEVNDVLRTASVVGAEFDIALVAHMLDAVPGALVELLVEPCRRQLVTETERIDHYRFAHALIRQTLAEELPAGRRARLHRSAADALETSDPTAHADIARHLVAAGPVGDPARAVAHAAAAAEQAMAHRAWEDGLAWCERALDLDDLVAEPDVSRRAGLLLATGRAKNALGRESAARDDLAAAAHLAREAGDAALFAAAAQAYGGNLGVWVDLADRRGPALLDEALTLLPAEPSGARARVLTQRALWDWFAVDLSEARRLSREGLAMAREVGDDLALLSALRAVGALQSWLIQDTAHQAVMAEFEEVARRLGNVSDIANALLYKTHTHLQVGDFTAVAETAMEGYRFATSVGARSEAYFAGAHLNLIRIASGRLDEALEHLDEHRHEEGSVGEELSDAGQRSMIAEVRADANSYDTVISATAGRHGAFYELFPVLGTPFLSRGSDEARSALRSWDEQVREHVPAIYTAPVSAWACRMLADHPEPAPAARCYETLLPWADRWPYPGPGALYGVGHHLLGLAARAMGDTDLALDHLGRGLTLHEHANLPLFIAESHLELARTLAARSAAGDSDGAHHRDEALRIATHRGFTRVELVARAMDAGRPA